MWLKPLLQHIVVDEAQDLSASPWRMLRAMVPEGPDDISLVGDAHQRIYSHQVVLGRLGTRTPGRASRRLTLNYRTTRQILGSAHGLVDGESFDDLDDEPDTLDGYPSVLTGLTSQFWRPPRPGNRDAGARHPDPGVPRPVRHAVRGDGGVRPGRRVRDPDGRRTGFSTVRHPRRGDRP
ncbi:hypothetical protein CG747_38665 [Streptomyces sp. CB02959]|nr:hypothetical protein CG747_38665 [Streptomyces sp. CB02959]